jgi:signal peptidase I
METESEVKPAAAPAKPQKRRRDLLRDLIEMVVVVFIVYFGFRSVLLPYQVDGASMNPYLENGERVFVSRTSYAHLDTNDLWNILPWEHRESDNDVYLFDPPKRGDIVVLHPPDGSEEPYIKRVIGLPGETVTFANGSILIDGVPLVEEYIADDITWCRGGPWCEVTVPEESVYVVGDNREHSSDSRRFGPVAYDQIIGKAIFSSWPMDTFGPIDRPDYTP